MKKNLVILIALFVSLNTFAQTGLTRGAKAPEFSAIDNSGKNARS